MIQSALSQGFEELGDERRMVSKADTAKKLRAVFKKSVSVNIYELDWDAEDVVASRRRYAKGKHMLSNVKRSVENWNLKLRLEQLENGNKRPDMLIQIQLTSLGTLFYESYDGEVTTNGIVLLTNEVLRDFD